VDEIADDEPVGCQIPRKKKGLRFPSFDEVEELLVPLRTTMKIGNNEPTHPANGSYRFFEIETILLPSIVEV
jgi:hypothetical protein